MRNISTSPFFVPKLRSFPTQFVKHRNRAFAALSVGLLAAQLLLPAAFAQTSNATLNGTVKDPSGAPSSGASVTATNGQTGIQKTVVTDGEGQYSIVNLTPGSYEVQVAQQNFATAVRRNQELLVGTTVTLDFNLTLSPVTQTVETQAAGPELQTTQNTIQHIIETKEVDDLPLVSRSFSDLAALTPGVLVGVGSVSSANISINNSPVGQTATYWMATPTRTIFLAGRW